MYSLDVMTFDPILPKYILTDYNIVTDSNVLCKETFIWNNVPCDKRGKLLPIGGAAYTCNLEYLYRRVASTHDLNAILFPPSSENTVRCIAV